MRDWLSIIIILLILGVLLDGIRRMRVHRRESLRMSRNVNDNDAFEDDVDLTSSEFPSGGPRVVGVRDTTDVVSVNQSLRQSFAAARKTRGAPKPRKQHDALKLDTPVPMLMDSVEDAARQEQLNSSEREPPLGSLDNLDEGDPYEMSSTPPGTAHREPEADEDEFVQSNPYARMGDDDKNDQPEHEDSPILHQQAPLDEHKSEPHEVKEPAADPESRAAPDEVLVINIMARRNEVFAGPELLDVMLSQGLRFGDMDIFHRHESADGRGKILFSVANMVVPGTFALEAMDDFESPGISMFLSLPIASDSLAAFNLMAESAQNIAHQLGGELKDENRSVMTRQTIEHGRQRVLEYERKRRLAKA